MLTQIKQGHLGGFVSGGHPATLFPTLWRYVVRRFDINSVVDIGCGHGIAAANFEQLGCSVLGVDGIKDSDIAIDNFKLNDYAVKSALTAEQFDLCWSCEFVEHVDEQYAGNFLADFAHAKYIVMTHATPGQADNDRANGFDSHHHVNEQPAEYWIDKIQALGYEYNPVITQELRIVAQVDAYNRDNKDYFNHFIHKGLFFKRNS